MIDYLFFIKKQAIVITIACFFFSVNSFAQETPDAVKYYLKLLESTQPIQKQTWRYMTYSAHDKKNDEKERLALVNLVRTALYNTQKTPPYKNDINLKQIVENYFIFKIDLMEGNALKVEDLRKLSKTSYDAMEKYIFYKRAVEEKSQFEYKKVTAGVYAFAERHGFNIVEVVDDDLTNKIKTASKIFNYKELMFLSQFRCQAYETYILNTFNNRNENFDFSYASKTLANLAALSRKSLDTIYEVNKDLSLRKATLLALDFYKNEAEVLFPKIKENIELVNRFNAFKTKFDKTSEKERSQQDVDEYNSWIKKINISSKKTNNLLIKYNELREIMNIAWLTAAENYIKTHIPNDVEENGEMAFIKKLVPNNERFDLFFSN